MKTEVTAVRVYSEKVVPHNYGDSDRPKWGEEVQVKAAGFLDEDKRFPVSVHFTVSVTHSSR